MGGGWCLDLLPLPGVQLLIFQHYMAPRWLRAIAHREIFMKALCANEQGAELNFCGSACHCMFGSIIVSTTSTAKTSSGRMNQEEG